MHWRVWGLIAIVLAGLLGTPGRAMVSPQDAYLYRVWSVESGLPQISVMAIVQDANGFLWLGTQNGLARFDGMQFDVFNTGNTAALSSNLITALHIDRQQRLWIGTVNGLIRYQHGQFSRLDLTEPLPGAISSFAELDDGRFFVGSRHLYQWSEADAELQQVSAHQGAVFQLFQQQSTLWIGGQNGFGRLSDSGYQWFAAPDNLAAMQISEIALQGNTLYLGSNLGLFSWQRGQWQALPLPEQADDTQIELLYLDPQQQLWVSSYNTLYKLQHGRLQAAEFTHDARADFVWIESMLQDRHGNLWLGSHSHGLKRLRQPPTERFSVAQGLPDPYVWAVQPWQQHLLVGTSSGLALLQHGRFQSLTANASLPNAFVYSLLQDSQQQLWVGTRGGLSRLDGQTLAWQQNYDSLSHLLVTTLGEAEHHIWIGTNGGLYYLPRHALPQHQPQQDGIPDALTQAKIRIVKADSQHRLWVGTENGLYLRDNNGFNRLDDMPLSGSFISAIRELPDGNMLIGSFDYGFVLGQPGHWRWFSQKNGLPGNGVLHVELIDNQLLISNFQGFYRVNYADLLAGSVTQLYMLIDDRRPEAVTDSHRCCNGAGSSKGALHQGRVWYPTLDGVIALPLQQLLQHAAVPVPVLESLTAAGQRYSAASVSLPPKQRDWHFRFTAPYFVQAASVQFRYRLQGYDATWENAGTRREAFYTNLPPGQYQFAVQVRVAADYRWSDTVVMDVQLLPHWYETAWARALFMLLFAMVLWGLYRWRVLALAHSRRQLAAQVAERTLELHQANEKLHQISMQDALTGLNNRHYLDNNIQQILSRANRHAEPLIWAVLDLDHFKQINDSFGHQTGDNILIVVADILRQNSRGSDHIIRWGGEEFLLILEHNEEAELTLQRIHRAISQYPWQRDMGLQQRLTCSIGAVAQLTQWNWQHSLRLADQALYLVKQHGRNGYLLLQAPHPVPAKVLAEDANAVQLLTEGKLQAISNKDFTASGIA